VVEMKDWEKERKEFFEKWRAELLEWLEGQENELYEFEDVVKAIQELKEDIQNMDVEDLAKAWTRIRIRAREYVSDFILLNCEKDRVFSEDVLKEAVNTAFSFLQIMALKTDVNLNLGRELYFLDGDYERLNMVLSEILEEEI